MKRTKKEKFKKKRKTKQTRKCAAEEEIKNVATESERRAEQTR